MGSYASVASFPAYLRMILLPPGCSSKNSVTSYTLLWTTIQQLSLVACSARVEAEIVAAIGWYVKVGCCEWSRYAKFLWRLFMSGSGRQETRLFAYNFVGWAVETFVTPQERHGAPGNGRLSR